MNRKVLLSVVCAAFMLCPGKSVFAQNDTTAHKSRLTIGGYGEAVYSHHFYSDNVFRYSHADRYKDAPGYGRVDIPHAVIMSGYDFGRGWSVGTEIEFEHGGVEAERGLGSYHFDTLHLSTAAFQRRQPSCKVPHLLRVGLPECRYYLLWSKLYPRRYTRI